MRPLIEYLPPHLAADEEIRCIQDAFTVLAAKWQDDLDDFFRQLRPETATWGLDAWEAAYGITKNAALSYERRREVLIARMRSARTATNAAICEMAESFSGGRAAVREFCSEYRFVVQLLGQLGKPEWFDDFFAALQAFAPAHLSFGVESVTGASATAFGFAHCAGWSLESSATALHN